MATWINNGGGNFGQTPLIPFDDAGVVTGGSTISAPSGVNSGRVAFGPAETVFWVHINVANAAIGDAVITGHQGLPLTVPTAPAQRRTSGRVVSAGVIEVATASSQPDGTSVEWLLVKRYAAP